MSPERIKELRDINPIRIENFRNTMRKKREERLSKVYERVKKDISKLNKREIFLCGLCLYWGEGLKSSNCTAGFSNTDPIMMKFLLEWLYLLGVTKKEVVVTMHFYSDMDIEKEIKFWLRTLNLPRSCLRNPSIKKI